MKNFAQKISYLFPARDLKDTIQRFPLSVICSLALFTLTLGMIHDSFQQEAYEIISRLIAILTCGFFWFGAARLYTESRERSHTPFLMLSLLVFTVLGYLLFISPQFMLHMDFIIPAMLLLISVAPFSRLDDNYSFWNFNQALWTGVAVAMLSGFILWGGVSAALASIQYLFDIPIDWKTYSDIGAFACLVIAPLNALSSVPRRFAFTENECTPVPGLTFLLNWVLAPLVLFYLLILYTYILKIIIVQELPRGQLSYMITGLGAAGIVTYLAAWPLRERRGTLLKLFFRYFFPALILPVCLMAFAAGERISQYGVTEQRYGIAMATLWLGIIAVLYTFRTLPLKFMPASLGLLLLLSSFGPWSATALSGYSQTHRLENLLVKNHILQNGKIVKTDQDIPLADRVSISSIVTYLTDTERTPVLAGWGIDPEKDGMPKDPFAITDEMGFKYVSPWDSAPDTESFSYSQPIDLYLNVKGYDYAITQISTYEGSSWTSHAAPPVLIRQDKNIVTVNADGSAVSFDVGAFVKAHLNDEAAKNATEPLMMTAENDKVKIAIFLRSATGQMQGGVPTNTYYYFDVLIHRK